MIETSTNECSYFLAVAKSGIRYNTLLRSDYVLLLIEAVRDYSALIDFRLTFCDK